MILDLIVIAIFVITVLIGWYRGFMYTLIHVLGWIGSLICAVIFSSPLASILTDTFIGRWVSGVISDKLAQPTNSVSTAVDGLPDVISGRIQDSVNSVSEALASSATNAIMTALSFLLILIVVRLLVRLITKPASRRQGHGLLKKMDRFLGMILGAIEGILLIYICLTILVPVSGFVDGNASAAIMNSLDNSHIAGYMYEHNILMQLTGRIFS